MALLPTIPSAAPTKIDVTSGAGVPGGFSGGSNKKPSDEVSRLNTSMAAISAKKANVAAAIQNKQPGVSSADLDKLQGMEAKTKKKLAVASKAPDFSKQAKLPSAPKSPAVPDFAAAGIPSVPAAATPDVSEPVTTSTDTSGAPGTEGPVPEPQLPPTATEKAQKAADLAGAMATSVNTSTAKKEAKRAKSYAKKAKEEDDKANKFIGIAEKYEGDADQTTDPVIKANLLAQAQKYRKLAEPHVKKADGFAQKASDASDAVKVEYDKTQSES
jgi:hypothetical protein